MNNEIKLKTDKQGLNIASVRRSAYKCGNCATGMVEMVEKKSNKGGSIDVKKCNKCKHQYGIMGVLKLEHYA